VTRFGSSCRCLVVAWMSPATAGLASWRRSWRSFHCAVFRLPPAFLALRHSASATCSFRAAGSTARKVTSWDSEPPSGRQICRAGPSVPSSWIGVSSTRTLSPSTPTTPCLAGLGAAAWIAFFAYYAMTGRFQIVYTTMFIYPSYYAGSIFKNVLKSLGSALYPRQLEFTAPLVFLTLVGAIVAWLKRSARPWALLIAYALATQLTIGIAGKFYSHYYQLWLPLFAVGAGWSIVLLGHIIKESYATWMPHAFAVIALVFMLQAEIWVYAMDPEHFRGWLRPGDEVRLVVEHLGELCQRVVAGVVAEPLSTGY